jgi:alpha-tubulin suppressor-like RCC1 family protein
MVDLGPSTYGRLIACGSDHTLVLAYTSNLGLQQLFAFGAADLGQLGLGCVSTSLQSSMMPTVRFSSRSIAAQEGNAASADQDHRDYPLIATIAAGGNSSFCLTESGMAFAWGENHCGQLGLGNTTTQHTPWLSRPSWMSA